MTATLPPDAQAREIVDQTLEAQALNHRQTALLANPSPERDSVLEWVDWLAHQGADATAIAEIRGLLGQVLATNERERVAEWTAAGAADLLARRWRNTPADGPVGRGIGGCAIARELGAPLKLLVAHDRGERAAAEDFVAASSAVRRLFDRLDAPTIFTAAVEHQLRGRRWRKLIDLHEQWCHAGTRTASAA